MARNVYGLDLGTYEIKAYDKKEDMIWKEKNVIAIANKKTIVAVGNEAYKMFEKAPENIEIVFPMQGGVISRFNDMQNLLGNLLKNGRTFARGSEYVVAVPTDVTEVEKKAFFDLVIHSTAKAKEVNIVERAVADAIGIGLDVQNTKGLVIVNFGAETTDISVLASGGIVLNRLLKIGGTTFDNAIVNLVRHNMDFLIGQVTAEMLRKEFRIFSDDDQTSVIRVAGRNLLSGVPQQQDIPISLVRAAMKDSLSDCAQALDLILDRTPPEILAAIRQNGIFLTGGVANMKGLTRYLEGITGIRVRTVREPEFGVVDGLKKIILSKDLKKLAYSMLDKNYRWMR